MDSIIELLKNEDIWFQLFDMIRIIEPGGTHRVITYQGKECFDMNLPCYTFWQREEHCANCTSKRASFKQKPVMKLEYRNNKFVSACPQCVTTGFIKKPGMVASITINGQEITSGGKRFYPDATVLISYHSFANR